MTTPIPYEDYLSSEAPFPVPTIGKLAFITHQTGQDEIALLGQALRLGLDLLYRQSIEQAFIESAIPREQAIVILGLERVKDIEYTKQALAQDIARGLNL